MVAQGISDGNIVAVSVLVQCETVLIHQSAHLFLLRRVEPHSSVSCSSLSVVYLLKLTGAFSVLHHRCSRRVCDESKEGLHVMLHPAHCESPNFATLPNSMLLQDFLKLRHLRVKQSQRGLCSLHHPVCLVLVKHEADLVLRQQHHHLHGPRSPRRRLGVYALGVTHGVLRFEHLLKGLNSGPHEVAFPFHALLDGEDVSASAHGPESKTRLGEPAYARNHAALVGRDIIVAGSSDQKVEFGELTLRLLWVLRYIV
mmetsp:Transcript_62391/g.135470  ORF Transcript_62391/g.135470 Transcript_62391/m.135470 type:complete len:256 (-) Transcript_62391:533-1300(-)